MSVIDRSLFVGLETGIVHLCSGGEAPALRSVVSGIEEYCRYKGQGMKGREAILGCYLETKRLLAQFVGIANKPDNFALLSNASEGLNAIASAIVWQPGDEVVSFSNEFPSVLLPWLARRKQGVTLRTVSPGTDPERSIENAITDHTRVICLSHVSYLTGLRVDLMRLSKIARASRATLIVDASHSLGVLNVPFAFCDAVVSCCNKFLLGPYGAGILYCDDSLLMNLRGQSVIGWHSINNLESGTAAEPYTLKLDATRFEIGNPPLMAIFALREGLRVLSRVGVATIETEVTRLAGRVDDALRHNEYPVITPTMPYRRGSSISFTDDAPEQFAWRLARKGVFVWGGEGRVRVSLHGYNDEDDIDVLLQELSTDVRPNGSAVSMRSGRAHT